MTKMMTKKWSDEVDTDAVDTKKRHKEKRKSKWRKEKNRKGESHKTIARAKRDKPATEYSIASGDSQCSSELSQ